MTFQKSAVWKNPILQRLSEGEIVIASTVVTPSVEAAAHVATLGFHFLWVEMEHSPITLETLPVCMVLATRGLPATIVARVPLTDIRMTKRVLDQGVSGVIFPFVSSPSLAERAAAACRYPPVAGVVLAPAWRARRGLRRAIITTRRMRIS